MSLGTWGFKSPLAHKREAPQANGLWGFFVPGFRSWVPFLESIPIRSQILFHVKRLVRGGLRASVAYGSYGS